MGPELIAWLQLVELEDYCHKSVQGATRQEAHTLDLKDSDKVVN